jgi:hypothetical protein
MTGLYGLLTEEQRHLEKAALCYAKIPSGPHLVEMLSLISPVSPRERMKKARLSWQKILLSKLPVVPS